MAGFSPFYRLAMFDFGDRLDYSINIQREIDRFLMIDRQLQGLYSVFDNGVITGWEVFDNGFSEVSGINVGITPGSGIIDSIAAQTSSTVLIEALQPSGTFGVYAYNVGSTVANRATQFYVGSTAPNAEAILISRIITSENGISSIDDTVRNYVNFEQVVTDLIANHKHRGTPPKVNLLTETKNELPGARIESLSAEKISSGRILHSCAPIIKHSDLSEIGVLSHPQLETLADNIATYNSNNNISYKELMGEIASVNLLQESIFLKYLYSDVDKYYNNEFIIIPGISPSSIIDEENSTAFIDTGENRIVGLPIGPDNSTYFFTDNISLPSEAKDVILTSNKSVPINSTIVFGVNTTNSTNFSDYQIVDEAKVEFVDYNGTGFRIGIKFDYSGPFDPYDDTTLTFQDYIDFEFENSTAILSNFHFRARWFSDAGATILVYETDSAADQERWIINDTDPIAPGGYAIAPGEIIVVSYFPDLAIFHPYQTYYLILDVSIDNGVSWTTPTPIYSYFTTQGSSSPDPYSHLPQVYNFGVMFSLLDNSKVQVNV